MKQKAKTGIKIIAAVYAVVIVIFAATSLRTVEPKNKDKLIEQVQKSLNEVREQAREEDPRHIREQPVPKDKAAEIVADAIERKGNIISVNFTLFMQWLNFGVLLLILYGYLWDPLVEFLDERKNSIQNRIEEAEKDRKKAEELRRERENELADIKQERADILEQGRREANKEREEIRERAQEEAERIVESAQDRVEEEVRRARSELQQDVVDLASDIAEKMLEREMSREDHDRIVDEMIEEFDGEDIEPLGGEDEAPEEPAEQAEEDEEAAEEEDTTEEPDDGENEENG